MTELKWKDSAPHYGVPVEYSAVENGIKAQIKRRSDEGWSVTVNGVVCASGADMKSAMIVAEKEVQRLMNYTRPERFEWKDEFDESFGKISKSEIVIDGQLATILIQSDGSYKVYFNASCIGGANDLESARDIALSKFNEITMPPPAVEWVTEQVTNGVIVHYGILDGHKATITQSVGGLWWPVTIDGFRFSNTSRSLDEAKAQAEKCLRNIVRTEIEEPVSTCVVDEPDPVPQLSADYQALKDAGNAMAAAAFQVATEYDGCHRLMLAVAAWATAVANEGGRGD